ncbi:hypothetical protein B484DRAFT_421552 [Ochromonadaceae sp. CCMP2298]|nr:hypothetical protein B484DRAFT_421552 [Ochromonadaceae sp. CCMP2298]
MRALLLLLAFAQTSGLRMRALRMGVTSVQNDEFFANHPESLRIFHPAFPLSILQPIPAQEAESIARVKKLINPDASSAQKDHQRLPWLTFPKIGVPDAQKFLSRREVLDLYEKNRHLGEFVWAKKLERPQKSCLLLNHWSQTVIYIAEYEPEKGARGYPLSQLSMHSAEHQSANSIHWPPLALEIELTQDNWQLIEVSDNIAITVLSSLPPEMPKALWELIFVLLLSPTQDTEALQALFDTGLSPQKGLIAYLRLLQKVLQRAELYDEVPEYRQISEKEIVLDQIVQKAK